MTENAIRLYQEMDDLVYSSRVFAPPSSIVVMSMWESDSSVVTAGSCLVSAFIFNNRCVIANGSDLVSSSS